MHSQLADAVSAALRPDLLFGDGPDGLARAFREAVAQEAVFEGIAFVGGVLLLIGLLQALIRQSDSPREMLMSIARIVLLAGLIALSRQDAWKSLVPNASNAMARAISKSEDNWKAPARKVGHFAELMYPAGDLKAADVTDIQGATNAGWYNPVGKATEKAFAVLGLAVRNIIATVILILSFVSLYLGWVIGQAMVWLSTVLFEFGWVLVPLALGALGVEALRGIGHSYLLGLTAVGTGQLALALAHVGTDALMRWIAQLLRVVTNVHTLTDVLTGPPSDALRQKFLTNVSTLPLGAWIVLLLATSLLAAWVIVTPLFAWKVFLGTLQNGTQFGSRLGMAFAGATLQAAGNRATSAGGAAAAGVSVSAGSAARAGSAAAGTSPPPLPSNPSSRSPESPAPKGGSKGLNKSERKRVAGMVARGMAIARSRTHNDSEVRRVGRGIALRSGASPAQADQMADAGFPSSPGPAAPAAAPAEAEATTPSLQPEGAANNAPGVPLRTYSAAALAVAGTTLQRAAAHLGSEEIPGPTDDGLVAAFQGARSMAQEAKSSPAHSASGAK